MAHRFSEIAFTPAVKAMQERMGSRGAYARREAGPEPVGHRMTEAEAAFLGERDSFYMATVGETGWPYIQHRGGPKGFVRVLDGGTIGFADLRGNRQYVTVGNLAGDDRVSLFFMDYPNRRRLKLFGRARIVGPDEISPPSRLSTTNDRGRVERGILIGVEGFDWNCPQHITERYALDEVRALTETLTARIAGLEAELARRPALSAGVAPAGAGTLS
jgi:predicted pyridoxine 5'-phosphate oxidase superfamily flavin-nucleotide-binding protein